MSHFVYNLFIIMVYNRNSFLKNAPRARITKMKEKMKMKNSRSRLVIYLPIVLALVLLCVTMRTIAMLTSLNFSTGYYSDKLIIGIGDWVNVAAVIFSLSYLATGRKEAKLVGSYEGPLTYIPSAAVSIALLFLIPELISRFATLRESARDGVWTIASLSAIITIILSIVAVIAFFLTVLRISRHDIPRAAVQIGAVLFFVVYAAFIYFDNEMPINSPGRITDITAYLLFAIFMLYETRLSMGREVRAAYNAFGLSALAVTAYSAIPSIITYLARGEIVSHSIGETVVTLTMLLFVLLRLISSFFLFEEKESPLVTSIREAERVFANEVAKEDDDKEIVAESENYTIDIDKNEQEEAGDN